MCNKFYITFLLKTVIIAGLFLCPALIGSASHAQLVITPPLAAANNSCFGLRDGRPHRGADYAVGVGTPIAPPPAGYSGNCSVISGYGNTGQAFYGNGVSLLYGHLVDGGCNGGPPLNMQTGNTGRSTGPHLHFEIIIDGQHVDPEEAYGLNLDDPVVRECLKEDGRQRLSGAIPRCEQRGVCGGGGVPYQGPPPIIPPTGGAGDDPMHPTTGSRPPITPPTYTPPTNSGGAETNVGPAPGGPVLWDSTEYVVGSLMTNSCDADIFVNMRGRAAMEAQEDIVASQISIVRSDSVLEYTCADQFMGFTAENGGPLFSETTAWVNRNIPIYLSAGPTNISVHLDETSLDQVLEDTVVATISGYVEQQFPMTLLGAASFTDSLVSDVIGGATYTCSLMSTIWTEAKCQNFAHLAVAPGGPFYTWDEMIPNTQDPRVVYNECGDTGLEPVDIDAMTNAGFAFNGISLVQPGISYSDYVDPAVCTGLPPMPTGITVVQTEDFSEATEVITEYAEHFCVNPGCYYDQASGTCLK